MPKPIKKKVEKKIHVSDEQESLYFLRNFYEKNQKMFFNVLLAVLAVGILSGGYFFWKQNINKEASRLEEEGYNLYYNQYLRAPMPDNARYEKALESFKKAYSKRPSPYSLFYEANCLENLKRYDEAAAALKELNQKFPDDERYVPLAYYKTAMMFLKTGKAEDALKQLEILQNYKSASFKDRALVEAAHILENMGKNDEAKKKYETLKKNFPNSTFTKDVEQKEKAEANSKAQAGVKPAAGANAPMVLRPQPGAAPQPPIMPQPGASKTPQAQKAEPLKNAPPMPAKPAESAKPAEKK